MMNQAIIIDDERPAISRMEKLIGRDGRLQVVGKFTDPQEALSFCSSHPRAMVFADIEMPGMNGIALGKALKASSPKTKLVYVTAYSSYALEAFDNYASGYLLKPVAVEKLSELITMLLTDGANEHKTTRLTARTIGSVSYAAGTQPVKFRTRKSEELFGFLLHKNGAWVDAEMISDVLWEHRAVSDIKKQLHTTVYYCRQALGQTGFGEMIESRHGAYRLDMSRIDWDYAHLSALLHQAANRPVSAETLNRVLDLDTGGYFESRSYGWVHDAHYILDARLEQFYEAQMQSGQHGEMEMRRVRANRSSTL